MSIDGLFPRVFSKVHPRFKTPYMALVIQGAIALVLSVFSGVPNLISFSVFNLAFCFLLVSLSLLVLKQKSERGLRGQNVLPWLGVGICLYLLYSTSLFDKLAGAVLILAGIPLYIYFSPKTDFHELKKLFTSEEAILERNLEKRSRFLANLLRLTSRSYRKIRHSP